MRTFLADVGQSLAWVWIRVGDYSLSPKGIFGETEGFSPMWDVNGKADNGQ